MKSYATYVQSLLGSESLMLTIAQIDPGLKQFLEERGEYRTPSGIIIKPGLKLSLGDPDGTTGYPRCIHGVGVGVGQAGNKDVISFHSSSLEAIILKRARYAYGIRLAFASLIRAYAFNEVKMDINPPYLVTRI